MNDYKNVLTTLMATSVIVATILLFRNFRGIIKHFPGFRIHKFFKGIAVDFESNIRRCSRYFEAFSRKIEVPANKPPDPRCIGVICGYLIN